MPLVRLLIMSWPGKRFSGSCPRLLKNAPNASRLGALSGALDGLDTITPTFYMGC